MASAVLGVCVLPACFLVHPLCGLHLLVLSLALWARRVR